MLPEILALVDIAEMNLHGRKTAGGKGIAYRDAGMGISGRIDQDPVKFHARIPDPVDERSFVIALEYLDRNPERFGFLLKSVVDLSEGDLSINGYLPLSEKLEIRAMNHKKFVHIGLLSR
jgi:hypothetical protein